MKYFLLKLTLPVIVVIAFLTALIVASIAIWIVPFIPTQSKGESS